MKIGWKPISPFSSSSSDSSSSGGYPTHIPLGKGQSPGKPKETIVPESPSKESGESSPDPSRENPPLPKIIEKPPSPVPLPPKPSVPTSPKSPEHTFPVLSANPFAEVSESSHAMANENTPMELVVDATPEKVQSPPPADFSLISGDIPSPHETLRFIILLNLGTFEEHEHFSLL